MGVVSGTNGPRDSNGAPLSHSLPFSFHPSLLLCLPPSILYLLAVFLYVVLIFLSTDKLSPNDRGG